MAVQHAVAMGMPRDQSEQAVVLMPPEAMAPVGAYLAHASCRLNGETLFAGPDHVSRLAVINTHGIRGEAFTAEAIADRIGEIMDPAGATVIDATMRLE